MTTTPLQCGTLAPFWRISASAVWFLFVGLFLLVGLIGTASAAAFQPGRTTLIRNVLVVDGTGARGRRAAVRIKGDRILRVGALSPQRGEEVVDGKGQVLAPGFIDTHSHHDRGLTKSPAAIQVTSQGITTIVVGQDGSSERPVSGLMRALERTPAAVNVASYAGHGTIRAAVMGKGFQRAATPAEIARMQILLTEEMKAGALGLSTGLEYDPGIYSNRAEVLALARTAASFGGRYISHMRSEDRHLWEALDEIIEIGRKTGIPVQVSHAKLAMVDWWGQAPRFIAKMDEARRQGVRITADIYPYEFWQSTLTVLFPDRNFTDRAAAQFALRSLAPAEGLRLSRYEPDPKLVGKTVAEIARDRGRDEASTLMDLIAATRGGELSEMVIGTSMRADDIAALIKWPHSNICSDGLLTDRHPRGAGSFTRILARYVREQRLLTLEEAVHKMSGLAAEHIGIRDRGTIRPGAFADLVLFDPAKVEDRATIDNPAALSTGISRVWVNGRSVLEEGRNTSARPGAVIRRAAAEART